MRSRPKSRANNPHRSFKHRAALRHRRLLFEPLEERRVLAVFPQDDSWSTDEDTSLVIQAPGVLENDSEDDGCPSLSVISFSDPPNGSIVGFNSDGSFEYLPDPGFHDIDSFTYDVTNGCSSDATGTITITVNSISNPPTAADDGVYTVNENEDLDSVRDELPSLLANDSDPDNDPLTAHLTIQAQHGTAAVNPDGSFTYTPNEYFQGADTFTYEARDSEYATPATVTIAVFDPDNTPPQSDNDGVYATNEDTPLFVNSLQGVLTNDDDSPHDTLTVAIAANATHGFVSLNADGSFTYTPAPNYSGPDSFTYRAKDGQDEGNIATVSLHVDAVNDAPVAVNNSYIFIQDIARLINFLGDDTDVDSSPLIPINVGNPLHGSLIQYLDGHLRVFAGPRLRRA